MLQPLRVPTGLPDSSAPSSAPGRANQCERAQLPSHALAPCPAAPVQQHAPQSSSRQPRLLRRRVHRPTSSGGGSSTAPLPWRRLSTCPTACSALCWCTWAGAGGLGVVVPLLDVLIAGLDSAGAAPCRSTHPLLPPTRRRAAAALLVSKRWHRVFLSEPALWRQFKLNTIERTTSPAVQASQLALLQRIGGLVACLKLDAEEAVQAAVMPHLRPSQLQVLEVLGATQPLLAALPRFSCLTRLDLNRVEPKLQASVGAAILQLPQLFSLRLRCNMDQMSQSCITAALGCTQLSQLHLDAGSFEQPQTLQQLTRLRLLSSLTLITYGNGGRFKAPVPTLLPALRTFEFACLDANPSEHVGVRVSAPFKHALWQRRAKHALVDSAAYTVCAASCGLVVRAGDQHH